MEKTKTMIGKLSHLAPSLVALFFLWLLFQATVLLGYAAEPLNGWLDAIRQETTSPVVHIAVNTVVLSLVFGILLTGWAIIRTTVSSQKARCSDCGVSFDNSPLCDGCMGTHIRDAEDADNLREYRHVNHGGPA